MKLVMVEDLKDGDVLANDVLLEDYTVVLAKGTVIKEPYIQKLRELEIFTVYIEQEVTKSQKSDVKDATKPQKKSSDLKISMEKITILRDDVEVQIKNKIKDIIELHVYQRNDGLEKIADTAQNIITDILEEDEVVEKVYDVKERSADIYEHSLQVCTMSTIIALKLGMSQKEVYDISVSALIHDLGLRYMVVRYEDQDINILPSKDQEEYKKHPIYAYTAVKNDTWLSEKAKDIILNHHERKDGSGYPLGTDLISRMTQIVAICDEFDEMICGVGKARIRVHEAINMIRNYGGIWFDDDIVSAFLQIIAVYPVGSKVKTNKGEIGLVMRQNPHFPERPIIRILEDRFGQALQTEKIIDLIKETTVVIQEVVR